jgi:cytochrome c-type biogenesis protein CcmE
MTDAMKKRLFGVAAIGVALSALGFVSMGGIGENVTYYWSPTELAAAANAKDATVRLGGMVVAGTMTWDRDTHVVTFEVTDNKTTVKVRNQGNPPQMFREGIGVVVEGRLGADGVFHSDKVMVSHGSEYQAPEDGQSPKHVYENMSKTLEGT